MLFFEVLLSIRKPVVSFDKMEKDFKHHIKLKTNIAKANGLLPIGSYKKKRMEIVQLPALSEYQSPSKHRTS